MQVGGGGGVGLAKKILTRKKEKEGNHKNPISWGRGGEHSFSLNFIVDFPLSFLTCSQKGLGGGGSKPMIIQYFIYVNLRKISAAKKVDGGHGGLIPFPP